MKWTKLSLKTTTKAVDLACNMINELGIEGIQIEDNIPITEEEKKEMFIDILPELDTHDKTATLSFYIEDTRDLVKTIDKVAGGLKELSEYVDIGEGSISMSETEEKDWINNWKEFFKPFRVDENIVIKPTWESLDKVKEDDIVIEIDPGTAFGTGSHETTKLCILSLKKYLKSTWKVLDVGCGSGILSIIALKLGADKALGIDIDPNAIEAAYENAKVNHISQGDLTIMSGNIIDDANVRKEIGFQTYDIVVANILADVIIPLSAIIQKHMKPDGLFITSGIINTRKKEVKEALLFNGFEVIETNEMGEWVSFVASPRRA